MLSHLQLLAPERTDLGLASDVSDGKAQILVLNSVNVETDCLNCGDCFNQFELVENGRLASCIQTNHLNFAMKRCHVLTRCRHVGWRR